MESSFTAAIARPAERLAACRVLTGAFPPGQRNAGAKWLMSRFANGSAESDRLFVARNGKGVVVAAAALHLDGAAGATIAAYRATEIPGRDIAEDRLISAICDHVQSKGVKVCQLIGKPEKADDYAALVRNGFLSPSRLVEFTITLDGTIRENPIVPFHLVRFHEDQSRDFARLLCATYEGTLDCPELNEVRTPEETLNSLRGNCRNERPIWFQVEIENEPIGVLMLNSSDSPRFWELTYLGLVTHHRHKGFGTALLNVALATATNGGAAGMTLTTDARNAPAQRMYESAGFRVCGSYDVFLKLFKS